MFGLWFELADFPAGRAGCCVAGLADPGELDNGAAAGADADLAGGGGLTVGAADAAGEAPGGRAPTGRTRVVGSSAGLRPSPDPFAVTPGDASAVIGDAPPPGFGADVPSGP
jgi:hypothetical protein